VGYRLGVDLGTTSTAAAVSHDGRPEVCWLEDRSAELPSLLLLREDGTFAVGAAAARAARAAPSRLARQFKRRTGDPTPFLLGGAPWSAHALTAVLLREVVGRVAEREGSRPDEVVVTHPANWGPYRRELLAHAIELADVPDAVLLPEPSAAVLRYAWAKDVPAGSVLAVYDLGGGTFDAAVLVCGDAGPSLLGTAVGIEQLGGVDFDDAVLQHVLASVGVPDFEELPDDVDTAMAVDRLRHECVTAKEALSSEDETTVPVVLPVCTRPSG
jgi:molecular chaperone DnaK (HSP70)